VSFLLTACRQIYSKTAIDAITIYRRSLVHFKEARLSNHLREYVLSSGFAIDRFVHTIQKLPPSTGIDMAFVFYRFFDILLTKVGIGTTYPLSCMTFLCPGL
jgi:hypothetical protein